MSAPDEIVEGLLDLYGARDVSALVMRGTKAITIEVTSAGLRQRVRAHLERGQRVGVHLLVNGTVKMGGIDLDAHGPNKVDDPVGRAVQCSAVLEALGLRAITEHTKRTPGTRVDVFFEERVPASDVRRILKHVLTKVGLSPLVEVFPKQDHEGNGSGNGLWLAYCATDVPTGRTVMQLGDDLVTVEVLLDSKERYLNDAAALAAAVALVAQDTRDDTPAPSDVPSQATATTMDKAKGITARIVEALLRSPKSKKTKDNVQIVCPLHDDTEPSAVVFQSKLRLYCSACGRSWRFEEWYPSEEGRELLGEELVADITAVRERSRANRSDEERSVEMRSVLLADVKTEKISWIWNGRIPRGKLSVLEGDPGKGKSTLTAEIAARVSRGELLEDANFAYEPANVLLLSAEDGLGDTIKPRLLAAGADLNRVMAITEITDEHGDRPPSFPEDLPFLREKIESWLPSLVIIDPLMSYLSSEVDSYRDQDVRRMLSALAKIADQTGAAILLVRHLNKGMGGPAMYRGGGSVGIIAAARCALLVGEDPDDPDGRVLAVVKSNLADFPSSLKFRIESDGAAGRIRWCGVSDATADQLVQPSPAPEDRDALEEACDFLREELRAPKPAVDVQRQAERSGITRATLRRAEKKLGLAKKKVGMDGGWTWSLPDSAHGVSTFGDAAPERASNASIEHEGVHAPEGAHRPADMKAPGMPAPFFAKSPPQTHGSYNGQSRRRPVATDGHDQ